MKLRRILAAAVGVAALLVPQTALAGESSNFRQLSVNEDIFFNFDNTTTTNASWQKVDWVVSMIFWNNANITKVKSSISGYWCGSACGGPMYLYLSDGAGAVWDKDDGKKTDTPSCLGDTRHYRVYADSDDMLYNTGLGRYVLMTTHKDFDEGCNPHFGESEQTERDIASRMKSAGYSVLEDYSYLYNYETSCPRSTNTSHPSCTGRVDRLDGGDHRWQSSGYGTYVRMT